MSGDQYAMPPIDQLVFELKTRGEMIPVELLVDAGWELPAGVTSARMLRTGPTSGYVHFETETADEPFLLPDYIAAPVNSGPVTLMRREGGV
jgi:hypothetical protein